MCPAPDRVVLDNLLARYCEPSRAYHTVRHLDECFAQFDEAAGLATCAGEVEVALWYHDVIYDTRSSRSEKRSASLAAEALRTAGVAAEVRRRVADLILMTRHDVQPATQDARLIVDVDLWILGSPPARFDEYEDQVRQEYAWAPDPIFRRVRAKVLGGFLARPSIYATKFFRDRLEAGARSNLDRSLARLATTVRS